MEGTDNCMSAAGDDLVLEGRSALCYVKLMQFCFVFLCDVRLMQFCFVFFCGVKLMQFCVSL